MTLQDYLIRNLQDSQLRGMAPPLRTIMSVLYERFLNTTTNSRSRSLLQILNILHTCLRAWNGKTSPLSISCLMSKLCDASDKTGMTKTPIIKVNRFERTQMLVRNHRQENANVTRSNMINSVCQRFLVSKTKFPEHELSRVFCN